MEASPNVFSIKNIKPIVSSINNKEIAEKVGSNGYQFMQKNQEIAVFVKMKGNWFWIT